MANISIYPVFLDNRPLFDGYLTKFPRRLSAFAFESLFAWKDFFDFDFRVIDGCLCVFARNQVGTFLYLPPVGDHVTPAVVEACFAELAAANEGSGVTRIENAGLEHLPLFPTQQYKIDLKAYEYVYWREDIAQLKGNAYKSKRSSVNQFVASYRYTVKPYEDEMLDECLVLYERWATARKQAQPGDEIYASMLDENRTVHETMLRYQGALGLTGRVVMIDGGLKAYTFGYPVDEKMFCVALEVADLDVKGLATFIFRELCRDEALASYKFVNGMDDFGMENITAVKMSFQPCALLPMYIVTKK